uniref:Transposase n=1 Tax=Globodera rostochiensis TaxID=31243 RepID=A0A914HRZ7_GLORO
MVNGDELFRPQRVSLFAKQHNLELLSPAHQMKNCCFYRCAHQTVRTTAANNATTRWARLSTEILRHQQLEKPRQPGLPKASSTDISYRPTKTCKRRFNRSLPTSGTFKSLHCPSSGVLSGLCRVISRHQQLEKPRQPGLPKASSTDISYRPTKTCISVISFGATTKICVKMEEFWILILVAFFATNALDKAESVKLELKTFDEIFGEGWWDKDEAEDLKTPAPTNFGQNVHHKIDRQNTQIGQIEPNSTDQLGQIEPNSTDQNPPLTESDHSNQINTPAANKRN